MALLGRGGRGRRDRRRGSKSRRDPREEADRDRLGLRLEGQHGPVRRSGARGRQDPRQADQREGRRRRTAPSDQDVRHPEQQSDHGQGLCASACSARAPTSSSRPATSTTRRRSCRRRSTAACWRSRPASAPIRWGRSASAAKGKLAFSFGNVAQDEGSAMAQYAWSRGWKTAALGHEHAARLLQERRPGVRHPVQAARRQDRRPRDRIATGANNVNSAVTRLNSHKAAVYVTSTCVRRAARVRLRHSARSATRRRSSTRGPVTGTYWLTKNPKVTNYYCVTYASVFGDDPSSPVVAHSFLDGVAPKSFGGDRPRGLGGRGRRGGGLRAGCSGPASEPADTDGSVGSRLRSGKWWSVLLKPTASGFAFVRRAARQAARRALPCG